MVERIGQFCAASFIVALIAHVAIDPLRFGWALSTTADLLGESFTYLYGLAIAWLALLRSVARHVRFEEPDLVNLPMLSALLFVAVAWPMLALLEGHPMQPLSGWIRALLCLAVALKMMLIRHPPDIYRDATNRLQERVPSASIAAWLLNGFGKLLEIRQLVSGIRPLLLEYTVIVVVRSTQLRFPLGTSTRHEILMVLRGTTPTIGCDDVEIATADLSLEATRALDRVEWAFHHRTGRTIRCPGSSAGTRRMHLWAWHGLLAALADGKTSPSGRHMD